MDRNPAFRIGPLPRRGLPGYLRGASFRLSHFSLATLVLGAAYALSSLVRALFGLGNTVLLIISSLAILGALLVGVAVVLLPERRARRMGLIGAVVAILLNIGGALVNQGPFPLSGVCLLFPVLGMYLGWFYSRRISRTLLAVLLISVSATLGPGTWPLLINTAIVSTLTMEMSSMVERDLLRQATIDPLTGALNRSGLEWVAESEIARAGRHGTPLTVVAIDLDDFKLINDRFGHAAGDDALQGVVDLWRENIRSYDHIGRRGGDEFVLLLPGIDEAGAEHLIDRLGRNSELHWSFGVAGMIPGDTLESMIDRADEQLYRDKQSPSGRRRGEGPASPAAAG